MRGGGVKVESERTGKIWRELCVVRERMNNRKAKRWETNRGPVGM